jgi:hypothetical protein
VAVLLDNFVAASLRLEREERARQMREETRLREFRSPMEPLLAKLANSFVDDADLSLKLGSLYEVHTRARARTHAHTHTHTELCAWQEPQARVAVRGQPAAEGGGGGAGGRKGDREWTDTGIARRERERTRERKRERGREGGR